MIAAQFDYKRANTLDEALSLLAQAEEAGFESLLAEHRRAWALRWERADVQIAGDADLQRATRVGLFHLMGCAGDRGEAVWCRPPPKPPSSCPIIKAKAVGR